MLCQDIEINLSMTLQQVKSETTETICQCWKISRYQVESGRGTDISTLPCQNLGEIADIEYFRSKLYRSLNVPVSRLEGSTGFNFNEGFRDN